MKDEMKKGKSLSKSFDEGNTKSLSSILDANITTLIAAFALYMFGTRTVKGFAIMLIISIFLTMVIMVVFNKFIVGLLCKSRVFQDKKHWFGIRKKDIPETNLKELPLHIFEEISHFFTVYKQLEGKPTSVREILGPEEAIKIIQDSIDEYENIFISKK